MTKTLMNQKRLNLKVKNVKSNKYIHNYNNFIFILSIVTEALNQMKDAQAHKRRRDDK